MTKVVRDDASAPYFDALGRGELAVRRCGACGRLAAPRVRACPRCAATDLGWTVVSGRGHLVSWTVLRDRAGAVTAVGGIVELAEGPWLRVRLAGDPAGFRAGLPMTVEFERRDGDETVPVFTSRAEDGSWSTSTP